jgi:hypothetical protein
MEHILIDCEAPGREKLWNLAQELWEKTGHNWPEINLGSIFACGLAHFKTVREARQQSGLFVPNPDPRNSPPNLETAMHESSKEVVTDEILLGKRNTQQVA